MSTYRLLPKIKYQLNGVSQKLPFYQCTVQLFQEDIHQPCPFVDNIGHSFDNDVLLLSKQAGGLKLYHPINCPLAEHAISNNKDMSRKDDDVMIGSVVLLRSADGLILLTRRSKKLKTFSGVWVPPGGHVELGETLEDAAIRELGEEVGITMSTSEYVIKPLCFFESCFPPFIEWGQPKRHHIVVYHLIQSTLTKDQLNSRLKLLEAEVDACTWLPERVVQTLSGTMSDKLPPVELITIQDGVTTTNLQLDPAVFTANITADDSQDVERLSTGTLVALKSFTQLT